MIAVRMSNDRAMDRSPRIDIKSARFAVQSTIGGADQLTKLRHDGVARCCDENTFSRSPSATGWTDSYDLLETPGRPVRGRLPMVIPLVC